MRLAGKRMRFMRIAISGLSGCGNTTVSKLVAEKLRAKRINYTLRNLAKGLKKPFAEVQAAAKNNPEYDYAVDRKQAGFAAKNADCVLASRLAIWADDPRVLSKIGAREKPGFGLKVWLEVPLEERARRIAQREKIPLDKTRAGTKKRDADNKARYKKLYGIDVSKRPRGTLVVDAEKNNAEQVAQIIITAAKKAAKNGRK
ncbi:MAG: cytidylate kinase family protein [Candidatus Micrarchaeia archaeon]|jgi:cytidylate kinase